MDTREHEKLVKSMKKCDEIHEQGSISGRMEEKKVDREDIKKLRVLLDRSGAQRM